MHPLINKIAVPLSGNAVAQALVEKIVFSQFLHYLIGIGAGAKAMESGEKVVFKLLKRDLKLTQPLCIFDVGANQGLFVKMTHQHLPKISFNIHAFEPGLSTFKALSTSCDEYDNVILNNIAFGKQVGKSKLYYEKEGSTLASLSKRQLDNDTISFNCSETIKIDTVDNYCFKHSISKIDLLKIDVEGHEIDVLRGASRMLNEKRIKAILFEFGRGNIDSRTFLRDFFNFFNGYQVSNFLRVTPSGYLSPVKKYSAIHERFIVSNFIVTM